MFSFLAVLLTPSFMGCSTTEVLVSHEFYGCENVDLNAPPDESLELEVHDLQFTVVHGYTFQACEASFEPELNLDGSNLEVVEKWTGGDAEACETCFMAEVIVKNPEPGDYSVDWFLPGLDESWEQVEFTVD